MVAQTDPRPLKAAPDGRMGRCLPTARSRRMGPLAFGLTLGAMLWLAIGLFSWHFFR